MRTLEERLTQAGDEARHHVDQIGDRPVSAVHRRAHQQRSLVGAAAVVLVVGAFGATALLVGNAAEPDSVVGAGEASPSTTVVGSEASTPVTVDTVGAPDTVETVGAFPRLGVPLDGWDSWEPVVGIESATGTLLIYEGDSPMFGNGVRISIETWSDSPGAEVGSGYGYALESIMLSEESLGEVAVGDGSTANAFTFTDPNTGNNGYYFLWQHSDTVSVEVIAYVDSFDQATAVVSSLAPFSEEQWIEILDLQTSGATVTTTSIAPSEG